MPTEHEEYLHDPDYKDPKKDWLIVAALLALAAVGVAILMLVGNQ